MNREQFRQKILDGNAQIQNHPVLWNHLSGDQQNMILSAQDFWRADNPITNAALDGYLVLYNTRSGR